jgi:hypothetical protein
MATIQVYKGCRILSVFLGFWYSEHSAYCLSLSPKLRPPHSTPHVIGHCCNIISKSPPSSSTILMCLGHSAMPNSLLHLRPNLLNIPRSHNPLAKLDSLYFWQTNLLKPLGHTERQKAHCHCHLCHIDCCTLTAPNSLQHPKQEVYCLQICWVPVHSNWNIFMS